MLRRHVRSKWCPTWGALRHEDHLSPAALHASARRCRRGGRLGLGRRCGRLGATAVISGGCRRIPCRPFERQRVSAPNRRHCRRTSCAGRRSRARRQHRRAPQRNRVSLCDERHRNERPTAAVGCSSRNRRAGYGGETADITLEDGGYSLPPPAFRECRHCRLASRSIAMC